MSYSYSNERPYVLTDEGQRDVIDIIRWADSLTPQTGVVTTGALMARAKRAGDSWSKMACVDRLVELGIFREVKQAHECAWQDRIFVKVA